MAQTEELCEETPRPGRQAHRCSGKAAVACQGRGRKGTGLSSKNVGTGSPKRRIGGEARCGLGSKNGEGMRNAGQEAEMECGQKNQEMLEIQEMWVAEEET
jgi:hypothetical protein